MRLWMVIWFLQILRTNKAQDNASTESCNSPLGLSSDLADNLITSKVEKDSAPSAGRLGNAEGAWCFTNDSISSGTAVLMIQFSKQQFVSGFASQGPPEKIQPKSYNHLVGFSIAYSLDSNKWNDPNDGSLFFNSDKNETSDAITYHTNNLIELARYVKINVTMLVSGSTNICLRFEIYGCQTDFQPQSAVQAITTPKGKIKVIWNQPYATSTLELDSPTTGVFRPNGYVVQYRPFNSQTFASAATSALFLSLEDVRLGAKYFIKLQCLISDFTLSCGETEIEAYPPCPEDWTGGNEYHCFLYLNDVSNFLEARSTCLNNNVDDKLGKLGAFVDEDEKKFLAERILPKEVKRIWFIRDKCQESEDCCYILMKEGENIKEIECAGTELTSAVCLRDHKGEGARLWVSSAEASNDGQAVKVGWRYEGTGWKTDKLQAKVWSKTISRTLTFSTLEPTFTIDELKPGMQYSLTLKPAPNIRTEEYIHKFIIIDFSEESGRFGAFLTPLSVSVFVIWSGTLKIAWESAKAYSVSGDVKDASKYSISHRSSSADSEEREVTVDDGLEFLLTPLEMEITYTFELKCHFMDTFYPCGSASVKTDPPKHLIRQPSGSYIIYEAILDSEKDWSEAEEDCQRRSGHLASLMTDAEGKTLLQMLPDKNIKVWTGAKLGKKASGSWTDGQRITYLPMAKNSGVTSDSESCCKALNEAGKFRLAGGVCNESLPYICKYLLKEIMASPSSLTVESQTWNSFEVAWASPVEGWLPSRYDITICNKGAPTDCKKHLKDDIEMRIRIEDLQELTEYEVTLEAVFKPVDIITNAKISAYTYPKLPVRYNLSATGSVLVETPMLIALGRKDAQVTGSLLLDGSEVATSSGNVKSVTLNGLIPEADYKLRVQETGSDWQHELDLHAAPPCISADIRIEGVCNRFVKEELMFEEALAYCNKLDLNQKIYLPSLWSPFTLDGLEKAAENANFFSIFWLKYDNNRVLTTIETKGECATESDKKPCCTYDASKKVFECFYCCKKDATKYSFICSYETAFLGKVTDLQSDSITDTSFKSKWSNPTDVTWIVSRFESTLVYSNNLNVSVLENSYERLYEGLPYGTECRVTVTPLGLKSIRGESSSIAVTTTDPRAPLSATVNQNGVVEISSPLLVAKERESEEVNVAVLEIDPKNSEKKAVAVIRGQAGKTDVTGLDFGAEYVVEMTPIDSTSQPSYKYSMSFKAIPSCKENQIQDEFLCIWPKNEAKMWKEATEICEKDEGELLDYEAQKKLSPQSKEILSNLEQKSFWMGAPSSGPSAALTDGNETPCEEFEMSCCSYDSSESEPIADLKCACCNEPKPFACKTEAEVDLGNIGKINVDEITATSTTLSWTMESESNWQKPSFLVTWRTDSESNRRKRSVDEIVEKDTDVTISNLVPGTEYKIKVAPYSDRTGVEGTAEDIVVKTKDDVSVAGFTQKSTCVVTILKITCCVIVILGMGFTVFVFISTRMLFLDCLAQLFSDISLLGAYLCILVSSSQSYSIDDECLRADPTLCVAVSALIQFFFQAVFLFMLLEAMLMCSVLKDYLPTGCTTGSPISLMIVGFGIPAVMNIVLAAIASDDYSDHKYNCWLKLEGRAMLPSVVPVIVFSVIAFFLLFSIFDADEPKEGVTSIQFQRGKVFIKTRWTCFVILSFLCVAYATGMVGASNKDDILNYVFAASSIALGILIPFLRIRFDDQVREQLKHGIFFCLRDDLAGIRVTPAPEDEYESNKFLNMSELQSTKLKQHQLADLKMKKAKSFTDPDIAWHR